MRRLVTTLVALAAALLGIAATRHAARAALGAAGYHAVKWGRTAASGADAILAEGTRAHARYPWNYRLCAHLADTAFVDAGLYSGDERDARLEASERWCDEGLRHNPFHGELRHAKARLLAEESLREAIAYWEAYVDWEYWDAFNQAYLLELHCRAGDVERARAILPLVAGSPYAAHAADTLRHAEEAARPPI